MRFESIQSISRSKCISGPILLSLCHAYQKIRLLDLKIAWCSVSSGTSGQDPVISDGGFTT
jgi:hypothetical protein